MSRPANRAICSYIDSSGYASGPISLCLFIDYIINHFIFPRLNLMINSLCEHINNVFEPLNKRCKMVVLLPACHSVYKTLGISRIQGYKKIFMLNSTEHEIYPAHKWHFDIY